MPLLSSSHKIRIRCSNSALDYPKSPKNSLAINTFQIDILFLLDHNLPCVLTKPHKLNFQGYSYTQQASLIFLNRYSFQGFKSGWFSFASLQYQSFICQGSAFSSRFNVRQQLTYTLNFNALYEKQQILFTDFKLRKRNFIIILTLYNIYQYYLQFLLQIKKQIICKQQIKPKQLKRYTINSYNHFFKEKNFKQNSNIYFGIFQMLSTSNILKFFQQQIKIAFYLHDCKYDLKLFHIGANQFTDKGLIDMLTGLQWNVNLQELYIGNNSFTEFGIEALVEVISSYSQLKILSLGNCGVTDQNFIQLSYQLSELEYLQQLSIQSNLIGDYGLVCFSALLTTHSLPSLRVFHFGDNPVTAFSLKHFFQALSRNRTLKQIYLNDIAMEISVIQALADCLVKNTVLAELNLGNTGFSNQAAGIIWPALKKSKLQSLQLWNNHLTDEGLLPLIEILVQQSLELTFLGLSDNEIKNEDLIKDINEYLKQHQWLQELPMKMKQQIQKGAQEQIKEELEQDEQEQQEKDEQEKQEQEQEQEEEEQEELDELEKEVEEANEIQVELEETENMMKDMEEQSKKESAKGEENEGKQGKLKSLKWTGEQEDGEDKTLLHSKLE